MSAVSCNTPAATGQPCLQQHGRVAGTVEQGRHAEHGGRAHSARRRSGAAQDGALKPTPVGPAVLEYAVDPIDPTMVSRVSIDLGSTIPERDSSLAKVDFGLMQLALRGRRRRLRPDALRRDPLYRRIRRRRVRHHRRRGGRSLDAVPASAHRRRAPEATGRELHRSADRDGEAGLREADFTAESDDRGVYLNEPGAEWSCSRRLDHRAGPLSGRQAATGNDAADRPVLTRSSGVRGRRLEARLGRPRRASTGAVRAPAGGRERDRRGVCHRARSPIATTVRRTPRSSSASRRSVPGHPSSSSRRCLRASSEQAPPSAGDRGRDHAAVLRQRACAPIPQRDGDRVRELAAYRPQCGPRHPASVRRGLSHILHDVSGDALHP